MSSKLLLRVLLCVWLVTLPFVTFGQFGWDAGLPDALRAYRASQLEAPLTPLDWVCMPLVIGLPICAIGILFLKRWARLGLTILCVLAIPSSLVLGPTVEPGWVNAVSDLSNAALYFALAMAWYSRALEKTTVSGGQPTFSRATE